VYSNISDINQLDLAITSVCNAKCMDCARWWTDEVGHMYHNPADQHANHHWPWQELCGHLDVLTHIKTVLICGNAGDPMSHPHVADVCEFIRNKWPRAWIEIDTNGSLGNTQTWQRLSRLAPIGIRFAVDGLKDTNQIYRRGVPWHRVTHNIDQWHSMGGQAVMKTIDFPWNEKDRSNIKAWAESLGWQWLLESRWHPELDQRIMSHHVFDTDIKQWPWPVQPDSPWQESAQQHIDAWVKQNRPMQAECKSNGDWLYINHDHRVWPCCYWANAPYVQWDTQRQHLKHIQRIADPNWNSLDHHSLSNIIQHPILQGMEKLWQGSSVDDTSMTCLEACGGCNINE